MNFLRRNWKKILATSTVVLCILAVTSILLRGWIRTAAIPAIVDGLYKGKVQAAFEDDFPVINEQLKEYGFLFDTSQKPHASCHVVAFEAMNETIGCTISIESLEVKPDDAYKTNWKQRSEILEKYLLNNSWEKKWNAQQPIDEILDEHETHLSIGVNYTKTHGKITCLLSIIYDPPGDALAVSEQNRLSVRQSCSRYVELFGGY